jgi:hypothetical protein
MIFSEVIGADVHHQEALAMRGWAFQGSRKDIHISNVQVHELKDSSTTEVDLMYSRLGEDEEFIGAWRLFPQQCVCVFQEAICR